MKAFFRDLFEYSHFMNDAIIRLMTEQAGKCPEKSIKLISHILNAHHIWNCRLEGKDRKFGVWDIHPLHDLGFIALTNFEISCIIVDNFDLEKKHDYITTEGQKYGNTAKDILFHVVNHSTYHRAQIVSDLKAAGIQPPVTDYIFYKR